MRWHGMPLVMMSSRLMKIISVISVVLSISVVNLPEVSEQTSGFGFIPPVPVYVRTDS